MLDSHERMHTLYYCPFLFDCTFPPKQGSSSNQLNLNKYSQINIVGQRLGSRCSSKYSIKPYKAPSLICSVPFSLPCFHSKTITSFRRVDTDAITKFPTSALQIPFCVCIRLTEKLIPNASNSNPRGNFYMAACCFTTKSAGRAFHKIMVASKYHVLSTECVRLSPFVGRSLNLKPKLCFYPTCMPIWVTHKRSSSRTLPDIPSLS